jgi:hypothetical protein
MRPEFERRTLMLLACAMLVVSFFLVIWKTTINLNNPTFTETQVFLNMVGQVKYFVTGK